MDEPEEPTNDDDDDDDDDDSIGDSDGSCEQLPALSAKQQPLRLQTINHVFMRCVF